VAANLIADSRPLVFEHPLLRTAVYLDVAAPVRAAEHAALPRCSRLPGSIGRRSPSSSSPPPGRRAWATAALAEAGEAALARSA
jgi:hypothetical protein